MTETAEFDGELTTPNEVAPKLRQLPPQDRTYQCPDCDESYSGGWAAARLGTHRVKEHGYTSAAKAAKAQKSAKSAKKAPVARKAAPAPTPPKGKPEPAQPVRKRQSASDILTLVLMLGGKGIAKLDPPVGSMVALEAPIAGPLLDKSFAGTPVDRWLLQPLAGGWETFEEVAPLLIVPAAIAVLERYPASVPIVWPMAVEAVTGMLPQLLKAKKAVLVEEKETEKVAAELGELDPEFAFLLNSFDEDGNKLSPAEAFLMSLLPPQPAPADAAAQPA